MNRDTPEDELRREVEQLRVENVRLRALLGQLTDGAPATPRPTVSGEPVTRATLFEDDPAGLPRVDGRSPAKEKIALFRALFAGREDIHAVRWENSRTASSMRFSRRSTTSGSSCPRCGGSAPRPPCRSPTSCAMSRPAPSSPPIDVHFEAPDPRRPR